MALKQQMKQTLGMTMTPQLQQAIKILQLSALELQQEVTNALVDNPTLEEVTDGDTTVEDSQFEGHLESDNEEVTQTNLADPKDDHDWTAVLEQGSWNAPLPSTRNMNSDDLPAYEQVMSQPTSLYEHLMWQLRMVTENPRELEIGEEIIGNINEDGYLMILVEELCERLKADKAEIESVLFKVQRFDPPGIAARDLQECLLIQSEVLNEDDEIEVIIEKHMGELENKNYNAIAKAMELPVDRVRELCKVIHDMEPRPGRAFSTTEPQYIVPDIYVVKVGKEFLVVLNEEGIPRLRISKNYQSQLKSGEFEGETKAYIKDKLKGAMWLMRSIMQRQRTIFRVTESIVKRQKDFFEFGVQFLKPMILRDIADDIKMHESTVSRVTTNKYVHTPRGIFELKWFFNSPVSKTDGGDIASEAVKSMIKKLIEGEDGKNPHSDQKLVELLEKQGVQLARRTVAKYREQLNILTSSQRKRLR
jgi:RNA polymerase sigma-54 factor